MAGFSSELSGSLIFNSASIKAALQPYSGGINISGSELYINEVGLNTRISTLESGDAGTQSLYPLNVHSASLNLFTSSLNTFTGSANTSLTALNTHTGSIVTRVTTLESNSTSYLTVQTLPAGTVSSSNQIETLGYLTSASAASTGFGEASLPAGTISSSQQIYALGYVTSSDASISSSYSATSTIANTASYVSAANVDGIIVSSSHAVTASYISPTYISASAAASGFSDSIIPAGTISSSQQIGDLGYITSSTESDSLALGVINAYTSSTDSRLASIEAATSSYATGSHTSIAALNTFTSSYYTDSASFASRIDTVTGSSDSTALNTFTSSYYLDSASFNTRINNISAGENSYDGDRIVSSEYFPGLTGSVNLGTTGSIQDFLDAVFFPNTPPSFNTPANQGVIEFATSGSTLVTLSATDAEGQSLSFAVDSGYTDDYVKVSSSGAVTLNVVPTEVAFNTQDRGDGTLAHPVDIVVTDAFGTSTTQTFYFVVSTNSAPVFRQTSVGGSIITSFTANRNENATSGEVGKIYFTDEDSDTITIESSSIPSEFSVTKYGTYVQINQETGSLDYETTPTFQFSLTASDEHYQAGQDTDASASISITVNVVDNDVPVVNDQTLGSISENSTNGASIGTIAASDNEGDTITFRNFTLSSLQLDGSSVNTGSYAGSNQLTDPHEDPFQMSNTGTVTRKNGVFLNSDFINRYIYSVEVVDSFNTASDAGFITININDDTPASLSDNWSAGPYIIESALAGANIVTTSGGSTQADFSANQSGAFTSSNAAITIDSNGSLTLTNNLSGSATGSGDTIDSTITFRNTFKTITTSNISVSVTANAAPSATFTDQSSNLNANLATQDTNLVSIAISDTESDTPYQLALSGTDAASFNAVPQNAASSSWELQAASDLTAGTYSYDITVTDNFAKSTSYNGRSVTVASADTGDLVSTDAYIIESATDGDLVTRNSNGRTGTQSSVAISYSPNYGSQSATNFASSDARIDIDSSGRLSVGNDISGSVSTNGSIIATTISWDDQYGNAGSEAISIEVTKNNAPTLSSTQTFSTNTNQARGTTEILRLSVSDTESDTIPNDGLTFSGYNSTYFSPSIATPQLKLLANSINIPAGTYPYTASLQDIHGFDSTLISSSITITAANVGTLGGDTSIYSIESALSGAAFRDATGYNQGNAAQVSVSYSPNYGSQAVQSYTSSNSSISIDSSGYLTLGVDISGSVTQSGDTLSTDITFTDQYGNVGSGSVTATIFGNNAPSANFTATTPYDTDGAISGSTAGSITVTDSENNSPFTLTLAGTDGGKFDVVGSSSPFTIQPTGSLEAGSYSINITVTDNYGESVTLTGESITVDAAEVLTSVYIYTSTRTGGGSLSAASYNGIVGITSENTSTTPATITGFNSAGPSPIYEFKSGELGSSTITVGGGTITLRAERSGSNLDSIISSSFAASGGDQIMILFPSGSTLTGTPTSMTDSSGTDTDEYILYLKGQSDSSFGSVATNIHKFDVDSAVDGYTTWNIIGRTTADADSSFEARLIPSSGSAPS